MGALVFDCNFYMDGQKTSKIFKVQKFLPKDRPGISAYDFAPDAGRLEMNISCSRGDDAVARESARNISLRTANESSKGRWDY